VSAFPKTSPQPWKRHAQLWKLHANKDQPVVAFATTGWPSFACTSRASSMEKTAFLGVSLEKDKNPWERKKKPLEKGYILGKGKLWPWKSHGHYNFVHISFTYRSTKKKKNMLPGSCKSWSPCASAPLPLQLKTKPPQCYMCLQKGMGAVAKTTCVCSCFAFSLEP